MRIPLARRKAGTVTVVLPEPDRLDGDRAMWVIKDDETGADRWLVALNGDGEVSCAPATYGTTFGCDQPFELAACLIATDYYRWGQDKRRWWRR